MNHLGHFTLYTPERTPETAPMLDAGGLFIRNEQGDDWYAIAHSVERSGIAVAVRDGKVCSFSPDATTMFPVDCDVYEVPESTSVEPGMILDGDAFVPPPKTSFDVDAERDRRIDGGFTFNGIRFQSRPDDRENIAGAATAALGAIMAGAQPGNYRWHGGAYDFAWIAADNSTHVMDAQTVYAFGQAALAHKQAHIFAGRAIKDADPIPADYTDDGYWPDTGAG